MSRGPGKIERALVTALSDDWQTMRELASEIGDTSEPSRAAIESVRRACRRLAEKGQARLDYTDTGYPTGYAGPSWKMWSAVGGGRSAYEPEHRPAAPCWELVAKR